MMKQRGFPPCNKPDLGLEFNELEWMYGLAGYGTHQGQGDIQAKFTPVQAGYMSVTSTFIIGESVASRRQSIMA